MGLLATEGVSEDVCLTSADGHGSSMAVFLSVRPGSGLVLCSVEISAAAPVWPDHMIDARAATESGERRGRGKMLHLHNRASPNHAAWQKLLVSAGPACPWDPDRFARRA